MPRKRSTNSTGSVSSANGFDGRDAELPTITEQPSVQLRATPPKQRPGLNPPGSDRPLFVFTSPHHNSSRGGDGGSSCAAAGIASPTSPAPLPSPAAVVPADALWYAGSMSRRQCEDAVRRGLSGCFLVHKGRSADAAYMICVNVRGVLSRLAVRSTADGFSVGETVHNTIDALVNSIRGSEIRCPPSKSHGSRMVAIGSPAPGGVLCPSSESYRMVKLAQPSLSLPFLPHYPSFC